MKRPLIHAIVVALAIIIAAVWLRPAAPATTLAQQDDQPLWRSSDAPVTGLTPQQLSPPDSPQAHQGLESAEHAPQAPDGIVLRNFRLPGSALRPRASSIGFYWGSGGGCIYNSSGNPAEIFNAPLNLPPGAMLNTVRMYYVDEINAFNSSGWVSVYDLYGELVEEWHMASSDDNGPGFADTEPIDHRVDYSVYSYALNWRPTAQGNRMQLCGFRVYYETPPFSFLPIVGG